MLEELLSSLTLAITCLVDRVTVVIEDLKTIRSGGGKRPTLMLPLELQFTAM